MVDRDNFDNKWEEHVKAYHGFRGHERGQTSTDPMDVDVDIDGLVCNMTQTYEKEYIARDKQPSRDSVQS